MDLASYLESIDLRQTRVPILIPFAGLGGFAIAQLVLGCDPQIVAMALAASLVTLLPMHFNGRDLYSICALLFGLRWVIFPLILKTLYRQPLEKFLFDPYAAYAWTLVIMIAYTSSLMLARRFDSGVETFRFPADPAGLRRLAIISFSIGYVGLALVASASQASSNSGAGPVFIIAVSLQNLCLLGIAAEACRNLEQSRGRHLFSPFLMLMVFLVFIIVAGLNGRGFFVTSVLCIFITAFVFKAIRVRYVIFALLFIGFFVSFFTPVILYMRLQKGMAVAQFVEASAQTAIRAATDPEFLKYIKVRTDPSGSDAQSVELDYYGDRSSVGNRVSYVALWDEIYSAMKSRQPVGIATVYQAFRSVLPGFLGIQKRPESLGDWLGWQIGLVEEGDEPFINYGLPMEGYSTWGWVGAIAYPFGFVFVLIMMFSKIATFRRVNPASIFILLSIQGILVEGLSDGFLNLMTRNTILIFLALFGIHFVFFRSPRSPANPIAAAAE